jgi:hypothetical protein
MVFWQAGCGNSDRGVPMMNASNTSMALLTERALSQGDTSAYDQLSLEYMDSPDNTFLYTALVMANKYEYPQAYMDVYSCLTDLAHQKEGTELDSLDARTRSLALEYLALGAKKGSKE